jgi:CBS domain-containing protein
MTTTRLTQSGKIMTRLPTVREFMTTKLRTLSPTTEILEAVDLLLKYEISGAPVVEDGKVVGLLSEKDCLQVLTHGVDNDKPKGIVSEFMTGEVESISPGMDIYYVAGLFLKNHFRRFPVVEDGVLVGVLSRRDVLRAVQKIAKVML